jgi:hypothetical protein
LAFALALGFEGAAALGFALALGADLALAGAFFRAAGLAGAAWVLAGAGFAGGNGRRGHGFLVGFVVVETLQQQQFLFLFAWV